MPALYVANALVPAICEEAIRSSYLFYMGDRGSRRNVVISLVLVFVIGEILYDVSIFPSALKELGAALAIPLLGLAIVSGAILHFGLTIWTADRQRNGTDVWRVFAFALCFHAGFNILAISLLGVLS